MQTELEMQTQDDAERELEDKILKVYRQNGYKFKPFFDRLTQLEEAKEKACSSMPELHTLAARVKTKQ
jgi:hypothetical protein